MLREIFTLTVDGISMPYYIRFSKERTRFSFQPTLKNKSAPSFIIAVDGEEITPESDINQELLEQACRKIRELRSDSLFDRI